MKILLLILITLSLYADVGTLIKIVDGDTLYFKMNGEKVRCRIEYIDTPESKNNKKLKKDISKCRVSNKDMKSAGKSATRYAKSILSINKQYEYETKGKDYYGRSICVVQNGNKTFNEQMVIAGYASIFRNYMNKGDLTYYEGLLQEAKMNRAGMWSNRFAVMQCLDDARR